MEKAFLFSGVLITLSYMNQHYRFLVLFFLLTTPAFTQTPLDSLLPVRGFCIAAPAPSQVDPFLAFIEKELAPRKVNTLILRVDYNYQFKSHPELRDSIALSTSDVKKLVALCKKFNIEA